MITAEKAIQNLQEVKEFCDAQARCEVCPFRLFVGGTWQCRVTYSISDWEGYTLEPISWDMEENRNE